MNCSWSVFKPYPLGMKSGSTDLNLCTIKLSVKMHCYSSYSLHKMSLCAFKHKGNYTHVFCHSLWELIS